jgi:hypothetical protein
MTREEMEKIQFNLDDLRKFVNEEISNSGPQIVSIPVPPYRHAFLVNVIPEKKRIMIADWNGDVNLGKGIISDGKESMNYNQYSKFMELLIERFKYPIKFYPINKSAHAMTEIKSDEINGGFCIEYIDKWVEEIMNKQKKLNEEDANLKIDFFSM